jgi:hypothetical protein
MRFTPGPWTVEKSEASSTGSVHYAVKTDYKPAEHDWSPRFIVFMCGGLGDFHPARKMNDYRSDPQIEADVKLIAASPDLYGRLVSAVCVLQYLADGGQLNSKEKRAELLELIDKCRSALASADAK